jgi:ribosomal protein S12 methylthiotransferase
VLSIGGRFHVARRKSRRKRERPSVGLISLGCAKNLVDSERLLGRLGSAGFPICLDPEEADVVLVNTCGFLREAVEESMAVIRSQVDRKKDGGCRAVVALGCLPSRLGAAGAPDGVDGWFGIQDEDGIESFLDAGPGKACGAFTPYPESAPGAEVARFRVTPAHWTYLRITEGCSNRCAYCTIPDIRGPLRCKTLEAVETEARELLDSGARELVLIGQDTAAWAGPEGGGLERVLDTLAPLAGLEWIRVLYAHPAHVTPALVRALAVGPPVLPYLDLPIQHASDRILEAMRRKTTRKDLERVVSSLREAVQDLVLRTTVMTGFPGEEDADFQALLSFVEWARFERLGVFRFSPEAGTPAASFPGAVEEAEARARFEAIRETGQALRDAFHRRRVGATETAVAEWFEGEETLARTAAEAPEVDPVLRVRGRISPGTRGACRITGLAGPDLSGAWIDES